MSHMGGRHNFGPEQHYFSEQGSHPSFYQRQTAPFAGRFVVQDEMAEFEQEFPELGNPELPIYGKRQEICEAVRDNQVVIVVGETGSGKSTQMPQMLLEMGYDVTHSQPRRMAARMVAERIQSELEETLGPDRAAGLVGHQTAEKSTVTDQTRISVITDGIEALKQLHDTPDDQGKQVHIIDEVHEWNTNIEISVALIKRQVAENPHAKFVLTSATMDAHKLAAYYAAATGTVPPVIEVPGRTHDIERAEKPESTVVEEILKSATKNPDEDILVFLPGKREISDTMDAVLRLLPEKVRRNATVLPLHAKLKPEEQDRVNQPTPGIKIVLATNVAQTSLTIDGIDVVIDSGLERRVELDDEDVQGLRALPVSQADCDQRAGRTGRVGPGKYILTRYDANTEWVPYLNRPKYPEPEILRTDINSTTLRTAAAGIDLAELDLFHELDPGVIERSKRALYNLGALDEQGAITLLGRRMSEFPVRPSSARMLMEALPYAEQVRAQLAAIVAAIEMGGLQYFAHDVDTRWKQLTDETSSDLLAQLDIFIAAQNMTDAELADYDLDVQGVRRAQELYDKIMRRGHVGDVTLAPPTPEERAQLERSIYAGLVDWVYQHSGNGNYERMGGPADSAPRELSGRSLVDGQPRLVVGSPYRVEFMRGGEPVTKHILERVTTVSDPRILGEVAAAHLLSWEPEARVWRDGRLKDVLHLVFNNSIRLGETRETDASDTKDNYALVRESLLEGPGPAQQRLRAIKKELENLQRRSVEPVPQLTQDMLLGLLDEAMTAVGEFDQPRIDNELRQIMAERGITLDAFVPRAERERIVAAAPDEIVTASGVRLALQYSKGTPVATKFSVADIENCPESLALPDGREILFWHGRQRMTLAQVKEDVALALLA